VSKRGKKTYGLGKFWDGKQGKADNLFCKKKPATQ